jgi:NlpC/P60 family putative phage cell wall peptidase
MDVRETEQREQVVSEARSWIGTPYHHRAGLKGVGCDCAYFLIRVYHACGLAPEIDPGFYKRGLAALRAGEQFYVDTVRRFACSVDRDPLPGDVVLFRFVRLTHGAIVERWPEIIHASQPDGAVVRANAFGPYLRKRMESVWTMPEWA